MASFDKSIPPSTDCSACKSCGGVRSNSAPIELKVAAPRELLGNSAILTGETSHLALTKAKVPVWPVGDKPPIYV